MCVPSECEPVESPRQNNFQHRNFSLRRFHEFDTSLTMQQNSSSPLCRRPGKTRKRGADFSAPHGPSAAADRRSSLPPAVETGKVTGNCGIASAWMSTEGKPDVSCCAPQQITHTHTHTHTHTVPPVHREYSRPDSCLLCTACGE